MAHSARDSRLWLLEDARLGRTRLWRALQALGYRAEVIASEPRELLGAIARRLPSLAVVDLSHAKKDRLWVVGALAQRFPEVRLLVVARGADAALVRRLELMGADEVVVETNGLDARLHEAIARAHRRRRARPGRAAAPPAVVQVDGLTPREREILAEVGSGSDNLKTAAVLGISERTVKAHVTSLFRKLGAANRVELALAARALT